MSRKEHYAEESYECIFSGIYTVQETILENKGSTVPLGIKYLRENVR